MPETSEPQTSEGEEFRTEPLVESTEQPQEEGTERELSPEEIERIMEKVQDIDNLYLNYGYNAFDPYYSNDECPEGLFKSILKSGFLASWGAGGKRPEAKDWPKYIRESSKLGQELVFHFAKLGEWRDVYGPDGGRGKLGQMRNISGSHFLYPGNIAIFFDLSKYKQIETKEEFVSKTFRSRGGGTLEGYQLKYRVAPRFFKGIVLYSSRQKNEDEIEQELQEIKYQYEKMVRQKEYHGYNIKPELFNADKTLEEIKNGQTEDEDYLPHVQRLAQAMVEVDRERPDRLLPTYDIYGNLCWPKQMSYEEVKEFVTERDERREDE